MPNETETPGLASLASQGQETNNIIANTDSAHEAPDDSHSTCMKLQVLDLICQRILDKGTLLKHIIRTTLEESALALTTSNESAFVDLEQRNNSGHHSPDYIVKQIPRRQMIVIPLLCQDSIHNVAESSSGQEQGHFYCNAGKLCNLSKSTHRSLYMFAEKEILRLFDVDIPDLCDPPEKDVVNEKNAVRIFSYYIHSAESMLHFLSQRPSAYLRVLLVAVIILMRNLMKILKKQEPSIMLVEFTMLSTEAIQLTQEFLSKLCIAKSKEKNKYEELQNSDSPSQETNQPPCDGDETQGLETLKALLKRCKGYRNAMMEICRQVLVDYGSVSEYEVLIPKGSPYSQHTGQLLSVIDSIGNDNDAEGYLKSIYKEAMLYEMERGVNGSSSKALSKFCAKAGSLLYKWGLAFCDIANEVNRTCHDSPFTRYRNIDVKQLNGVPVLLYRQIKGVCWSLSRSPEIAQTINRGSEMLIQHSVTRPSKRTRPASLLPPAPKRRPGELAAEEISRSTREQTTENNEPQESIDTNDDENEQVAEVQVTGTRAPLPLERSAPSPVSTPTANDSGTKEARPRRRTRLSTNTEKLSQQLQTAETTNSTVVQETGTDANKDEPQQEQENEKEHQQEALPTTNALKVRRSRKWNREDVIKLVDVINKHGAGKWAFFSYTYFRGNKTGPQLKDKWCNLTRYKHVYQVPVNSRQGDTRRTCWKIADTV